jgi:hypothetical protein
VIAADSSRSHRDAWRAVLEHNGRPEAEFERSHRGAL